VVVQVLVETWEAFAGFVDGSDIFVQDEVLRRGGQTTSESQRRWAGLQ